MYWIQWLIINLKEKIYKAKTYGRWDPSCQTFTNERQKVNIFALVSLYPGNEILLTPFLNNL